MNDNRHAARLTLHITITIIRPHSRGSYVLVTFVSAAKTAEPIEMPLGDGLTHVDPRNHVLDKVKVGQIYSPPRGMTRRRCGRLS